MIRVGDEVMALEGNGRLAGQAALRYDLYIATRSCVLDRYDTGARTGYDALQALAGEAR